jgi:cytochrome P450
MPAKRNNPTIPNWSHDQLDSAIPPEIDPAYFDSDLNAWVLSKHADILAAFRTSSLAPAGLHDTNTVNPEDDTTRSEMRAQTMEALSPAQLRQWREQITPEVQTCVENLPLAEPVDLMNAYARPLCLSLAAMVTRIPRVDAARLYENAQRVSAAAAEPYDPALRRGAKAANAELRTCFHSGPEALRDSGFVALSQTLPCLLGNAWFALMQHPHQWSMVHQQPGLTEQAVDELLRYAGLARTLTRIATADINLNGSFIRKGDRIILRIIAGNRDSDRFPHPHQVDVTRSDGAHFTLGSGPHSCVAAGLIRMVAVALTRPLVQRFGPPTAARPVDWQGGSGFRFPRSLWVCLHSKNVANGSVALTPDPFATPLQRL